MDKKTLPKVEIVYSYIYNKVWDDNFIPTDKKVLMECSKGFEEMFSRHIDDILNLISRYTGYTWSKPYIPVYIVRTCKTSFSNPVTIRFSDNKLMFLTLIHELVHNNIRIIMQDDIKEPCVDTVTKHVLNHIDPNLINELTEKFPRNKIVLKFNKNLKSISWNLEKHPVKYYLNKRCSQE